jgi:hypothetical protein
VTESEASEIIEAVRKVHPGACALARVVSLAARIEPALLRRARLELLPIDVGAEADLWFSPMVQSRSPLAIVFLPAVAQLLRCELARDQGLLKRAWDVVKHVHAKTSPVIGRFEEEVTYWALSDHKDAAEKIRELLLTAATAMVEGNGRGLAQWALRALPRLPDKVRESDLFWALVVGAGARLGGRQVVAGKVPEKIPQGMLRWVLPSNLPQVQVGVRLLEAGIEFSEPPGTGAHGIPLPKTDPLVVEVSWGEGPDATVRLITLRPLQTQVVETPSPIEVSLRSVSGDSFTIRRDYEFDVFIDSIDPSWGGQLAARLQEEVWKGRSLKVAVEHPLLSKEGQVISEASQADRGTALRDRRASRKVVQEVAEETLKNPGRHPPAGSGDAANDPRLIRIYRGAAELPPELGKYVAVDFRDDSRFEDRYRKLLALIKGEPFIEPSVPPEPVELYYSYAHQDKHFMSQLEKHLAPLGREGIIKEWHDGMIPAGSEWQSEISEHLDSAALILLLVSAHSLGVGFSSEVEMKRALERHDEGEALLIPVILSPCDWRNTPLGRLQALPQNAQPITEWSNPDEAFQSVAQGIRLAAAEVARKRAARNAPDPGLKPHVFISHRAGNPFSGAALLLVTLTDKLAGAGFDVFADRTRLQPGHEWPQGLNEQMARADAAVLLLSREALESQWVQREVTVLFWRREHEEKFILVPVLIEGVELKDVSERLTSVNLQDLPAIRAEGSPEQMANQIVEVLAPQLALRQPSYYDRLVKLVADCLHGVPEHLLREIAEAPSFEIPAPEQKFVAQKFVARRLVRGSLEQLPKLLQPLERYLDQATVQRLIELVAPTWVNPEAAAAVRRVTKRPPGQRLLCVNCKQEFTGKLYVSRASETWPPWRSVAVEASGEDINSTLNQIRKALQGVFGADDLRVDLEKLLEMLEESGDPVFVLLPEPLVEYSEEIRSAYPTVTLFLMTGKELPSPGGHHEHFEMIHPVLAPGKEDEAYMTLQRLRFMFDRHSGN